MTPCTGVGLPLIGNLCPEAECYATWDDRSKAPVHDQVRRFALEVSAATWKRLIEPVGADTIVYGQHVVELRSVDVHDNGDRVYDALSTSPGVFLLLSELQDVPPNQAERLASLRERLQALADMPEPDRRWPEAVRPDVGAPVYRRPRAPVLAKRRKANKAARKARRKGRR